MTRRRHCPGSDEGEAVYREFFDVHAGKGCSDVQECDRCRSISARLDALCEPCEAQGCTLDRCIFDPPRYHHADPPPMRPGLILARSTRP